MHLLGINSTTLIILPSSPTHLQNNYSLSALTSKSVTFCCCLPPTIIDNIRIRYNSPILKIHGLPTNCLYVQFYFTLKDTTTPCVL